MAWLERHRTSNNFHVVFRLSGKRFRQSLRTDDRSEANARVSRLEENIRLVESGRLSLPEHGDPAAFLLSDGKLNGKPRVVERLPLADLVQRYRAALPDGALELESLRILELHIRHFVRIVGGRKLLGDLSHDDLQRYVLLRSREPGKRGMRVSVGTMRKELATLTTLWNWALRNDYVSGALPKSGLKFPKLEEPRPFQTYEQISSQVHRGGLTSLEVAELWDCLFLSVAEVDELLSMVRDRASYRFLYPMVTMAAHTGARRSELCRSREMDIDFKSATLLIREKKKSKGTRTTRLVPLTTQLRSVLEEWFDEKAESPLTFPTDHQVSRNRRPRFEEGCVSPDEASHHLDRVIKGTKWEKIRGWHIFRHSFISSCACAGVDQRMIDSWVGHQTDAMRRRYTHLFPNAQHRAIASVFDERSGDRPA